MEGGEVGKRRRLQEKAQGAMGKERGNSQGKSGMGKRGGTQRERERPPWQERRASVHVQRHARGRHKRGGSWRQRARRARATSWRPPTHQHQLVRAPTWARHRRCPHRPGFTRDTGGRGRPGTPPPTQISQWQEARPKLPTGSRTPSGREATEINNKKKNSNKKSNWGYASRCVNALQCAARASARGRSSVSVGTFYRVSPLTVILQSYRPIVAKTEIVDLKVTRLT